MSTEEVCLILEASVKSGVSELLFRDLHVKFGTPAEKAEQVLRIPYPFMQQPPAAAPVTDLTEQEHEKQNQEAVEKDELTLREERLARALVEDPVFYEQLLRDGELSDAVGNADIDDGESDTE